MRIYIFKSETRKELRAFAGDPAGSKLPQRHGPWTGIGVVRPEGNPPHRFSRMAIEDAINGEGFQLWRLTEKAEAPRLITMNLRVRTAPGVAQPNHGT